MTQVATNSDITYDTGSSTLSATQFSGTLLGNATGLQGTPNINVQDIAAQTISVGGTLTCAEIGDINAVGSITANNGINVAGVLTTNNLDVTSTSTFSDKVTIGTPGIGITLYESGNADFAGDLTLTGNADFAGDLTLGGDIIRLWEPLKNRFSYQDYQGAMFLNGNDSDYAFADNRVTQTQYRNSKLYLGNGYIVPSDYAETIEWTTAIPNGAFSLPLQSSNDRINWSNLVNSVNGLNTYTFIPGSQPVALRFDFSNRNGTNSNLVLADVKFPNMRASQLVDQGTGGGCVVESTDWVATTGGDHLYTMWADGTLICQYKNTGSLQSGGLQWNFPKSFISTPGVSYGGCRTIQSGTGEGNGILIPGGNNNVQTNYIKVNYLQLSGFGNAYRYFGITAIGRWK
jgi:hypothetical protein